MTGTVPFVSLAVRRRVQDAVTRIGERQLSRRSTGDQEKTRSGGILGGKGRVLCQFRQRYLLSSSSPGLLLIPWTAYSPLSTLPLLAARSGRSRSRSRR